MTRALAWSIAFLLSTAGCIDFVDPTSDESDCAPHFSCDDCVAQPGCGFCPPLPGLAATCVRVNTGNCMYQSALEPLSDPSACQSGWNVAYDLRPPGPDLYDPSCSDDGVCFGPVKQEQSYGVPSTCRMVAFGDDNLVLEGFPGKLELFVRSGLPAHLYPLSPLGRGDACGALAVDGSEVYWGEGERVHHLTPSPTMPLSSLSQEIVRGHAPIGLAAGGGRVYWVNGSATAPGATEGLFTVDGCGEAIRVADVGQPAAGLALAGGDLFTVAGAHLLGFAGDGHAIPGDSTRAVAPPLASDGRAVYYAGSANGSTWSATALVPGAAPSPLAVAATAGPYAALAVDDQGLYFADAAGTVGRVPLSGGAVHVIASGQGRVSGLAVGPRYVYWFSGISLNSSQKRAAPRDGGAGDLAVGVVPNACADLAMSPDGAQNPDLAIPPDADGGKPPPDSAPAPDQSLPVADLSSLLGADLVAPRDQSMPVDATAPADLASPPDLVPPSKTLSFAPPASYPAGMGAGALAVGDLDGDQRLDLVVCGGTQIAVLLGKDLGKFTLDKSYTAGTIPLAVAIGDWTSDGTLDVAVADNGTSDVAILPGAGAGKLGAALFTKVSPPPAALAAGRLDGDTLLDVAVALPDALAGSKILILHGHGDGTFPLVDTLGAGTNTQGLAVADWNGDGLADLVASNLTSNDVTVILRKQGGGFSAPSRQATGMNPGGLAAADLDGDGDLDLVVQNFGDPFATVLLGVGDGTFKAAPNVPLSGPLSVATADLDGDGKIDLAAVQNLPPKLVVLRGDGKGGFQPGTTATIAGTSSTVAAGDFDRDGLPDLVVSESGGTVQVFLNTTH